ncbi:MAG: polysaccharide pyruvyl transferase family protein [Candidatus Peribacteraceae bacterium]|nr:polysaccharide pyruvyl transferase family protein [Candidatus Peribacteraceae bacterium]
MRYLLIGNYGVGNIGDEALKEYFLHSYPDVNWTILSAHPRKGEMPRFPLGVRSLLHPWWRTLHALYRSDGVVFGGGTLFTDIESVYACILWWWHAFIARLFKKQVHLAFQGIGPFRTSLGEWLARSVVASSVTVSVRDLHSFERIKHWRMNKKIILTFDPVISLINEKKVDRDPKNVFIIIPRRNSNVSFLKQATDSFKERQFDRVLILSLQPDNSDEERLCEKLRSHIGVRATVLPIRTLRDLVLAVASGSQVLCQRYHGALVALALGKPVSIVPQETDDKLSALRQFATQSLDRATLIALVRDAEDVLRSALRSPGG